MPRIRALATPTPMIEPIRVWDEEAGRPSHQVPRFQIMAAISKGEHHGKAGAAADLQDELDG
jgi:hypothetical protein